MATSIAPDSVREFYIKYFNLENPEEPDHFYYSIVIENYLTSGMNLLEAIQLSIHHFSSYPVWFDLTETNVVFDLIPNSKFMDIAFPIFKNLGYKASRNKMTKDEILKIYHN